jgi:hypothetical protein
MWFSLHRWAIRISTKTRTGHSGGQLSGVILDKRREESRRGGRERPRHRQLLEFCELCFQMVQSGFQLRAPAGVCCGFEIL